MTTWRAPTLALALLASASMASVAAAQTLEQRFAHPTEAAKPRVWWHWIDGNVTAEGITRDLEWMKSVGIGGFQVIDVGLATPALVPHPVAYRSPEWQKMLGFAASEARRLGLEMSVMATGGWSETGGPWVTPQEGMKKLVWSETQARGGRPVAGALPAPPIVSGPFQDAPTQGGQGFGPEDAAGQKRPALYRDVAVIAYRTPPSDRTVAALKPVIASSNGPLDPAALSDGKVSTGIALPLPADGTDAWIEYRFAKPTTIRSITIALQSATIADPAIPNGKIEVSDDGRHYRPLLDLPGPTGAGFPAPYPWRTYAIAPTTARFFRATFDKPTRFAFPGQHFPPLIAHRIGELSFSPDARINRFEGKAGFTVVPDGSAPTPEPGADSIIDAAQIVDVTSHLRPDGQLDWTPPVGRWTILRFGYSLEGTVNHPATTVATGLEVDKLNGEHVRRYLDGFYAPIAQAVGADQGSAGLQDLLNDSWEAGSANWTEAMIARFKALRGYDPTPWLPVLAGRIVTSPSASEKFLWDFRRTIADLVATEHYATLGRFARERGLGLYSETMAGNPVTTMDSLEARRYATVPMAEFWQVPAGAPSDPSNISDVREAASAAHVFGQNIVAAEAFTAPGWVIPPYSITPWQLKPIADRFFALGLNRVVLHASVHQPLDKAPGFTLGPFGQYLNRLDSWANVSGPWFTYLARTSQLLQEGRFVADIAYFYGEGAGVTVPLGARTDPALPAGYGFDFVSRDVVLKDFSVENGTLLTPTGMRYRLMVLPAEPAPMTLELITRLRDLVTAGATLLGPRPVSAAGLATPDSRVLTVADQLWGGLDGKTAIRKTVGQGCVIWGPTVAQALALIDDQPDIEFKPEDADIASLHRLADGNDIYFLVNGQDHARTVDANFRISGRAAELWHADSGLIEPVSVRQVDGRSLVSVPLDANDAVFVVFRPSARSGLQPVISANMTPLGQISGGWTLSFPAQGGEPAPRMATDLGSWTRSGEPATRYFSGTATYTKTITVPRAWLKGGGRILLDLGGVREIASVAIDGKPVGIAWKPPYAVDVTGALHAGRNALTVAVTNLWPNRLIGDQQQGSAKAAFTTFPFPAYNKDSPLADSGLIGPVRFARVIPATIAAH